MSAPSVETSPPAFSWHPKLTLYRLTFIVTTGGLGIAKATLVSKGQTTSSITMEWITGVIVALRWVWGTPAPFTRQPPSYLLWRFCTNNPATSSWECTRINTITLHILLGYSRTTASTFQSHSCIIQWGNLLGGWPVSPIQIGLTMQQMLIPLQTYRPLSLPIACWYPRRYFALALPKWFAPISIFQL